MTKNKHRFIPLLLAAAMILSLLPASTFAADVVDSGECGENVTWTLDSDGLLTISGTGEMENYSRFGVLSPFKDDQDIKYVVIEDGVTSIGVAAFDSCTDLTGVIVPGSIMIISEGAFYGCSGLKSVTLPDTLKLIEYYAFYDCTSLTSITIPGGVTGIEDCAFENCTNIKDVYYPGTEDQWNEIYIAGGNSCLETAEKHFNSAPASDPVTDPVQPGKIIDSGTCGENLTWTLDADGLLTISGTGNMKDYSYKYDIPCDSPFWGNNDIREAIIEAGVTKIGSAAFYECENLTRVTIPEGVTSIGEGAFSFCSALESVTVPDGVTSIDEDTFRGCGSLTEIILPDSLTSIGTDAFLYCSALTSIEIPNGVTSIGGGAFGGCGAIASVTIPEGVTAVEGNTFSGCTSLTSVTVPDSVTYIRISDLKRSHAAPVLRALLSPPTRR